QDIFDYIEFFYNSKRRHNSNKLLSPIDYENQFKATAQECLQN
ncbi:MAG: IS3 family transposase, partial [Methylophilaceae bacterium]|nr:IS3 family transposase [Methylophilaceae bacterium]MDZ4098126.1 IS3 family transposase [Methylophilaceae bacterium]MDZ4099953.1 IS3 family transposase [Methylophilaceae bacterium]